MDETDWYDTIEEPIRNLVKILRDNGFNTTCSCGHMPNPNVEMEWYEDSELTKLYNLLVENGFKNFTIRAIWSNVGENKRRYIILGFHIKEPLAKESDIRDFLDGAE